MQRYLLLLLPLVYTTVVVPAWATDVDGFRPTCGAPGDVVYVQGVQFAPQPVVTFGGLRAEMVRTGDDVLLCRVPQGLAEGFVELRVDGAPAPLAFQALSPGRPVVHTLSTAVGGRGQAVFAYGRRLHHGRVAFVDAWGHTVARAGVVGGRRAVVFRVPDTLDPGPYEVVVTNGEGLATGPCTTRFEVVRDGDPGLHAVHPCGTVPSRGAAPGQPVRCLGSELGPLGPCRVHFTDRHGVRTESRGRSNGYGVVLTAVPGELVGGEAYDVEIELRNGALTPPLTWTPARRSDPDAVTVAPSSGPAGCYLSVRGDGLSASIADVRAELSSPHGTVRAEVVYRHPGGLGHGAAWVLRVPQVLAEGDYDLILSIDDHAAPAVRFRVEEQDLIVTGLWPKRIPLAGGALPTLLIEGSGFGPATSADDLRILWTNGTHAREGPVAFRSDRALRVVPPGACPRMSVTGERWSVYVLRGRGIGTRMVRAGAVIAGDS